MKKSMTEGNSMISFFVYLAVIVSGAAVLAIELLGTRLIAPFYGSDIYLWSALISITLAALSCGYAVGGRFADRSPQLFRLSYIIGIAGLWIAVIPWLRSPLFALAQAVDLRLGVLLIAFILFFPPLALLGMVSPYAIRLRTASVDSVGTTSGNLYAVSTVASVVAALVTGFILIPHVGVQRLFLLTGLLLVLTAGIGLITQRKVIGAIASLIIVLLVGLTTLISAPVDAANNSASILAVKPSAYADVRVVDKDSVRYLLIDGSSHSAVDLATGQSCLPYVNVLDLAKGFSKKSGRMLSIGLGGGSVVKNFARDGWVVDAVEIDPVVTQMARTYFGLTDKDAHIYEMDGRQFLMTHNERYDVIIMDAYGSSFIPFHLVTQEAFELVRTRLEPNGVVGVNLECVGWHDPLVASLAATIRQKFQHVIALPIAEPPDQLGNLVLMASDRSLVLEKDPPVPTYRFSPQYDRAHAWDNRFEPVMTDAPVLTDDLNPIDTWSSHINLASRANLHKTVDVCGIAW
jgi:spermidine synthase